MNILLVEPYYGGSHKAWADGYRDHSVHEVRLATMTARFEVRVVQALRVVGRRLLEFVQTLQNLHRSVVPEFVPGVADFI